MIPSLKNLLKALATADAIIQPEWEHRYFSYDSSWGDDEEMASMRDGTGGHWFVHFQANRVGYLYISPNDGSIENFEEFIKKVPEEYKAFLQEPAFNADEASGIWLLDENEKWLTFGKQRSEFLEDLPTIIDWGIIGYKEWAEAYYEKALSGEAIDEVFKLNIQEYVIKQLNPNANIEELLNDLEQIGIDLSSFDQESQ